MFVENVTDTSQNTCLCGGWLKHSIRYSGQTLGHMCSVRLCSDIPLVGAHVRPYSSIDRGWYIAPLCSRHNEEPGPIEIASWVNLVPANVSSTCGARSSRLADPARTEVNSIQR